MSEKAFSNERLTQDEDVALKAKKLEIRLKEIEIADKEYAQKHRPSAFKSSLTNPAVIAAAIAAWATLSAAGVTLLSGQITSDTQREAAIQQADLERLKFEANLITESIKTGNPDQAATNLQFLVNTGLLGGTLGEKVKTYLMNRNPGEGRVLPPH